MKKLLNKKVLTAAVSLIVAVLASLELSGVASPICAVAGAFEVAPASCAEVASE